MFRLLLNGYYYIAGNIASAGGTLGKASSPAAAVAVCVLALKRVHNSPPVDSLHKNAIRSTKLVFLGIRDRSVRVCVCVRETLCSWFHVCFLGFLFVVSLFVLLFVCLNISMGHDDG